MLFREQRDVISEAVSKLWYTYEDYPNPEHAKDLALKFVDDLVSKYEDVISHRVSLSDIEGPAYDGSADLGIEPLRYRLEQLKKVQRYYSKRIEAMKEQISSVIPKPTNVLD